MDNYKISFGICTYNRKGILEKSVQSLKNIKGIENVHLIVFDDCSDEYNMDYLKSIFPSSAQINRQERNEGADKNTSLLYEKFLESDDEWLFTADSDLIYRSDLLDAIMFYKDKSNGFMSFFNCISHKIVGKNKWFVFKASVGAAGCLIRRDVVKIILDNIQHRDIGFDVGFSKLLRKKGFMLNATKKSYVQHIGVSGFNSRDINFDYGEGFIIDSKDNAEIVEQTFEQYIKSVNKFRNRSDWRAFYFIISIHRRIRRVISGLCRLK